MYRRLCVAVWLLASVVHLRASAQVNVTLAGLESVEVGQAFVVEARVDGVTDLDVALVTLGYDDGLLSYVSANVSGGLTDGASLLPTPSPGAISAVVNMPGISGVSGTGSIVSFTFRLLAPPDAPTDIALTEVLLGNTSGIEIPSTIGAPLSITAATDAALVLLGCAVVDDVAGNGDGVANPGERIQLCVTLQNVGSRDGADVVALLSAQAGVTIVDGQVDNATWLAGETRDICFVVDIAPDTVGDVAFTVDVTATGGLSWQFPCDVAVQVPPVFEQGSSWITDQVTGNGNGQADPGERIQVKTRLRNIGLGEGRNVVVTLGAAADAVVVDGQVSYPTWPAGEARTVTFVADIGALANGPATFDVDVTADYGGPWSFTLPVLVVGVPPDFEQRSTWIRDKVTGNANGKADPGERIEIKTRLRNFGLGAAQNLVVSLSTADDAVVVDGQVTHPAWPAGEARTLSFVADIGASANGVLTFDVDVTPDNGGPWHFTLEVLVVGVPPDFEQRSTWIRDKVTGNANGKADPGERVEIKARLRNIGLGEGGNVAVSLSTADDASVVDGQVTYPTWAAGEARTVTFIADIGASANGVLTFDVDVTADNGGPRHFTLEVLVVGATPDVVQVLTWMIDKGAGNGNRQADAGERVEIRTRLRNIGPGEGRNVVVTLSTTGDAVVVDGPVTRATWPVGEAHTMSFVVDLAIDASGAVAFAIDVTAASGGPWQFGYSLPVVALPVGGLAERSFWARDKVTGNADGKVNPGERVEIKARLKNEGATDFVNVVATLSGADPNVTPVNGTVTHATWPAGVARNNDGLSVDIGVGASGSVAFTLNVTADNGGPWQFTYSLPVAALPAEGLAKRSFWARDKVTGNADGQVNPGERVEIKARLKNESATDFLNVVATLGGADPNVTPVNGTVTHATWPAGVARNNNGLLVDIGSGASGSVAFTLDVTADNGGPWQFTYTLPIVATPASFAQRTSWARDKVTGDGDGQAEPGERIEVRARLKNEGQVAGANVVVTLSTTDANVTVVAATVTHATWPAGVARNNEGFVVDLGAGVGSTVAFTIDVTADNAEPRQFTFSLPVTVAPAPTAVVSGLPAATDLLPNYPNPFNPETWIPFDLAEAGDVTITIYSAMGAPVRRLDLGLLSPGVYRSRHAAAYWDGRNDLGERVASGVYVYELRAGGFREMRRMLVQK